MSPPGVTTDVDYQDAGKAREAAHVFNTGRLTDHFPPATVLEKIELTSSFPETAWREKGPHLAELHRADVPPNGAA